MKNNIKKLREQRKFTQKELANKSNVSLSYIQKLEMGQRKTPSLDYAIKIAEALDTTVQDLFFPDNN